MKEFLQKKQDHPRNKNEITFIAKNKDQYIGGANIISIFDWVLIDQIIVEDRHHGIGTEIVKSIEEWSRKQGKKGLFLYSGSWQAEDFYQKMGFSIAGNIPEFSNGKDVTLYIKKL